MVPSLKDLHKRNLLLCLIAQQDRCVSIVFQASISIVMLACHYNVLSHYKEFCILAALLREKKVHNVSKATQVPNSDTIF